MAKITNLTETEFSDYLKSKYTENEIKGGNEIIKTLLKYGYNYENMQPVIDLAKLKFAQLKK